MQLYFYDHCPFCTRVRMALTLKNQDYVPIALLNDDEATPLRLIGQKMLPILIKEDSQPMAESLDIVAYIDQIDGTPLFANTPRNDLKNWLKSIDEYQHFLVMPRASKLPLPEFATISARDYFDRTKTAWIGNFDTHIAHSAQYIERLEKDLQVLVPLITNNNAISMEDILLFPVLRNLTMVADTIWPEKIMDYLHDVAQKTNIALYFDFAL